MRHLIQMPNQILLIQAIATWQEEQTMGDYSAFIESIVFFPWKNGVVSALIMYRDADGEDISGIEVVKRPVYYPSSHSSERAVFSAMAGGTDGG